MKTLQPNLGWEQLEVRAGELRRLGERVSGTEPWRFRGLRVQASKDLLLADGKS
jgi:hypothetical protein